MLQIEHQLQLRLGMLTYDGHGGGSGLQRAAGEVELQHLLQHAVAVDVVWERAFLFLLDVFHSHNGHKLFVS